jgi:hypothetical protein
MSRCGKTGGIPKKFHTDMKEEWLNAKISGKGEYLKWIAEQWGEVPAAKKAEYNKNRPKNANAKAGICVKKEKPKWKNNIVGRTWIKHWAEQSKGGDPSILKKWDHMVKTQGTKSGLRKTKLSNEKIFKFIEKEFGFNSEANVCATARMNKTRCRGWDDVTNHRGTWDNLIKDKKWKLFYRNDSGGLTYGFIK